MGANTTLSEITWSVGIALLIPVNHTIVPRFINYPILHDLNHILAYIYTYNTIVTGRYPYINNIEKNNNKVVSIMCVCGFILEVA